MLCARMLKAAPHRPAEASRRIGWFDRLIARLWRMLKVVLRHQITTLMVALGTLALTVALYVVIPKGFFPVQDTGLIQGVTEASQSISSPPWPSASRRW